MIITIIAPAKRMEMREGPWCKAMRPPFFEAESAALVDALGHYSVDEVAALMTVSHRLAEETVARFYALSRKEGDRTPALFAYRGDAYQGIEAEGLDADGLAWAEDRLRILSGLYGALSPTVGVMPYRLEMGLSLPEFGRLSAWWRPLVTEHLQGLMGDDGVLLNLASAEYARAVDRTMIKGRFVEVIFKESRAGDLKVVAIHAKRARGAMVRWIIENRIDSLEAVKGFDLNGYRFDAVGSQADALLFVRPSP